MASIRYFLKALHCVIGEKAWLPRATLCLFVYNGRFDCDQSEAALGALLIVGFGTLAECSVCICKIVSHRRYHEAVRYGHIADLDWAKHIWKLHIFIS